MLAQLSTGHIDLAVLNWPVDDPEVTVTPLFAEDLMFLAHANHPLADREEVTIAELGAHPLLLPPVGTTLRDEVDDATRRVGTRLQVMAEIDGVRLMASLAMEGLAGTIIPATAVPGWVKGAFRRIRVAGLPRRQVGLARRRRARPSAPSAAVADLIIEVVVTKGKRQRGLYVIAGRDGAGDEPSAPGTTTSGAADLSRPGQGTPAGTSSLLAGT